MQERPLFERSAVLYLTTFYFTLFHFLSSEMHATSRQVAFLCELPYTNKLICLLSFLRLVIKESFVYCSMTVLAVATAGKALEKRALKVIIKDFAMSICCYPGHSFADVNFILIPSQWKSFINSLKFTISYLL